MQKNELRTKICMDIDLDGSKIDRELDGDRYTETSFDADETLKLDCWCDREGSNKRERDEKSEELSASSRLFSLSVSPFFSPLHEPWEVTSASVEAAVKKRPQPVLHLPIYLGISLCVALSYFNGPLYLVAYLLYP